MTETSISPETLKFYFHTYTNSLKNYPDKYLHLFFESYSGIPEHLAYLCPICLKNGIIAEKSIGIGMHNEFSLDHFPPQSVGGFQTMLVCKKCNNEAGNLYDFSLKEKIQNLAFNNKIPAATLKAKSKITDVFGSYPSTLIIDSKGQAEISLKPFKKIHAPYLDKFLEFSKTNSDYQIELNYNVANESKVSKALIKVAYLSCFDIWGYDFAFSNTGDNMRDFLSNETESESPIPIYWLGTTIRENKIQYFPLGVCYLRELSSIRSFAVNIRIIDKETGFGEIASVIIPGPTKENWDQLKSIKNLIEEKESISISYNHITDNIIANNILDGYHKSWEFLNLK